MFTLTEMVVDRLKMIKLVTLDFDGTTADTMPTLEQIAVKLITKYYLLSQEEAKTKYRLTTGLPFLQQIEQLFPGHPANNEVIQQFEEEKKNNIFSLPLFDDTKETIKSLKNMGFIVAISSSTTQPTIEEYCRKKGLFVDQILGFREGFEKGKDHFDFLMKKFHLTTKEILYVGDSLKDCERAQAANILFIGKIGLFTKEDFDRISQSKLVITKLSELTELLKTFREKENK